ncbi:MerR family DNA-binding transcriptional regulator [Roseicella aerolata]|uniref:MerR family DNA-binding transcriptional regulator n=1 Tax=Roseicella aerolata TaxID=2883479 RepID=UPI0038D206BA
MVTNGNGSRMHYPVAAQTGVRMSLRVCTGKRRFAAPAGRPHLGSMNARTTTRAADRAAAVIPIGQLAREAGCKVQTVRWYEEIGILPPPARPDGGWP